MSYFKKNITYIELYENEVRQKNIGFIKTEVRNARCKIQVSIQGLHETDTLSCEMQTANQKRRIDHLSIKNGRGSYIGEFPVDRIGSSDMSYEGIYGIYFVLSGSRYGLAEWKPGAASSEAGKVLDEVQEIPQKAEKVLREESYLPVKKNIEDAIAGERSASGIIAAEENGAAGVNVAVEGNVPAEENAAVEEYPAPDVNSSLPEDEKEEIVPEQNMPREQIPEEFAQGEVLGNQQDMIFEDKWSQLRSMFQNVHPFQKNNGGEYIVIQLKDFVVLTKPYQALVNNSFLLHGYYNYRQIILSRKITNGMEKYYIGVPGNYYEREKSVAAMFGFEGFEQTRNVNTGDDMLPPQMGEFGYYWKQVEI